LKTKTAELRALGLTVARVIDLTQAETNLSLLSTIKKHHIPLLRHVNNTLFVLIRLMHRIHEILFCYQFTLVSLNEYYNLSGTDINSSFKSIIQLTYETYLKQQNDLLHHNNQHQSNNSLLDQRQLSPTHSKNDNEESDEFSTPTPVLSRAASAALSHQALSQHGLDTTISHYHDDLVFENQDLTSLLIHHTHDILHSKVPQLSPIDQFVHLKTKTLQTNKMLMSECLPLFISLNETMSILLRSTLTTVEMLLQQSMVPTTLSFALKFDFSYPSYHTHNTTKYQLYLAQKHRVMKLVEKEKEKEKDRNAGNSKAPTSPSSTTSLLSTSTTTASITTKCTTNRRRPRQSKLIPDPSEFQLFLDDEVEYLNQPYAHGCLFTFLGFKIGPCCNRSVKYQHQPHFNDDMVQVPTKAVGAKDDKATVVSDVAGGHGSSSSSSSAQQQQPKSKSQQPIQFNVDIEMGEVQTLSNQSQESSNIKNEPNQNTNKTEIEPTTTPSPIPKLQPYQLPHPVQAPTSTKRYPNPYYDRSYRRNQQRQYVFQLVAYLRQVRVIFQEMTYQRFYGGRDGYYTPYPTSLINIEHSFLAAIEQCPPAFIELVSQLSRLEEDA
jgi:hypothetical protein